MSKKRKLPKETHSSSSPSIDDPSLKSSAVDRLVEAQRGDDSGVDPDEVKEVKKSKGNFFAKIPPWIKAIFFKWWFAAATCFFLLWGLGGYTSDQWARILILGVGGGVVTDLLTNNFLRLFETGDKEFDPYILFTARKKFWTLFANVAYATVITLGVVYTYNGINAAVLAANPSMPKDSVPFPVEPLLYGVFYLVYDMAVIGVKDLIVMIHKRKRYGQDE